MNICNIEVCLTNDCNYRCKYCWNYKKSICYVDVDKLITYIKNISNKYDIQLLIAGDGEPTLHKDFMKFIEQMSKIENIKIIIFTNGSQDIQLYKTLLDMNIKINFSWHSLKNDIYNIQLLKKIKELSKSYAFDVSVVETKEKLNKTVFNMLKSLNIKGDVKFSMNDQTDEYRNIIYNKFNNIIKDEFNIHRYVHSDGNVYIITPEYNKFVNGNYLIEKI